MNKKMALSLVETLSAIELAMLIDSRHFPDYLHDKIFESIEKLREIILYDGKSNKIADYMPILSDSINGDELVIAEINGYRYVLGPEASDEMTWDKAQAWCKSKGYELPDRLVLLACFMNPEVRAKFKKNWYWSSTEFLSPLAWKQNFANGYEYNATKDSLNAVRAVRKVLI